MAEEIKTQTLEEQYIEKAKELFNDEELYKFSKHIEDAIYETSSTVIRLFKTWWEKQVIAQKKDLSDHINQDLKDSTKMINEKTFDDLMDEFINEKIKLLLTETSNKTEKIIYNPVK